MNHIILAGPTACGKSSFALALAKELNKGKNLSALKPESLSSESFPGEWLNGKLFNAQSHCVNVDQNSPTFQENCQKECLTPQKDASTLLESPSRVSFETICSATSPSSRPLFTEEKGAFQVNNHLGQGFFPGQTTVINGDSIQLYQGLPLLTAAPKNQDKSEAPHLLYESLSWKSPGMTAADWSETVGQWCCQATRPLVIAGGTGFYLDTLMRGLSPIPHLDEEKKAEYRIHYATFSLGQLKTELKKVDPILEQRLVDPQRIIYALMIHKHTGRPLSFWHQKPRQPSLFKGVRVFICPDRQILEKRAQERWKNMMAEGVIEETEKFCQILGGGGVHWRNSPLPQVPITRALGFQDIVSFLKKEISMDELSDLYLLRTRQYIKRQMTWFSRKFTDKTVPYPLLVIPRVPEKNDLFQVLSLVETS